MNRKICRVNSWIGGSKRGASRYSYAGRYLGLVARDFGGQTTAGLWTSEILDGFELRSYFNVKIRDLEVVMFDA